VKDLDSAGLLERKLENPLLKDTIMVPRFGYTIVRFFADNPGVLAEKKIYFYFVTNFL